MTQIEDKLDQILGKLQKLDDLDEKVDKLNSSLRKEIDEIKVEISRLKQESSNKDRRNEERDRKFNLLPFGVGKRLVIKGNQDQNLPGLIIGTLNIRTLKTEDRLIELEEALKESSIDIFGIAEVRRHSEKMIERSSGFIFYHFGETSGHKGVGFLVRKELKTKIVEFKDISERIALMKLKTQGKLLHIFQVYAPTSMAEEAEHESFYNSLTAALSRERNNWKHITLIIGDFNSQVGKQEEGERLTVGKYGYGTRNDAGQRLVDFCQEQGLRIVNTFFKKRAGGRSGESLASYTSLSNKPVHTTLSPQQNNC
ncbi:craniofacial development protein 2-like [Nilaparvata lugens]|uniref:craniofacial development protein 2-like n=1 Tax=Nilaparvata lugens TaxID=108931 RepID=UPI00193E1DD1|nr:craniofacial development protein 2-like [Nilaparvata lugens]